MMNGMTVRKIAISLPEALLARATAQAKRQRASSLSAYIGGALEQQVMRDDVDAFLHELLEESGGHLTKAEIARADALLDSASTKRRSPARAKHRKAS